MKVLVAGDVHGNVNHATWLIDTAVKQGCEKIVQVGDFGAWEHMADGVDFFDAVGKYATRNKVEVYFLRGNHDKSSLILEKYGDNYAKGGFLECRPGLYYIPDGHWWMWEERTFAALGGAYSVDKGLRVAQEAHDSARSGTDRTGWYWFPEEEATDDDVDRLLYTLKISFKDTADFFFSHDKPFASNPQWNRKSNLECIPNTQRVQRFIDTLKPSVAFHGHLHYRYTDMIRTGDDDQHCTVIGLDCDPAAGDRFYRVWNSCVVLDLSRDPKEEECVASISSW